MAKMSSDNYGVIGVGSFGGAVAKTLAEAGKSVIAIDIDEADNPTITDWDSFKWAFGCLDFVAYCGLSVSGRGVWAASFNKRTLLAISLRAV